MRSAKDKDHLMSTIAGSGVYVIASTRASSVASSSSGPGKLEARDARDCNQSFFCVVCPLCSRGRGLLSVIKNKRNLMPDT